MPWQRKVVAVSVTVAVAAVLLCSIAYMLFVIRSTPRDDSIVLNDQAAKHLSESLPVQRRSRAMEPDHLLLAQIPWATRDLRSATAAVPMAVLPPLPIRHDLARPTPVSLKTADVPWQRHLWQGLPARVYLAELPSIRPRRDPNRPEPVKLSAAGLPWAPRSEPGPAAIPLASLPKLRSAVLPDPAALPLAQVPWTRDPSRPAPAHVSSPQVPSSIKHRSRPPQ